MVSFSVLLKKVLSTENIRRNSISSTNPSTNISDTTDTTASTTTTTKRTKKKGTRGKKKSTSGKGENKSKEQLTHTTEKRNSHKDEEIKQDKIQNVTSDISDVVGNGNDEEKQPQSDQESEDDDDLNEPEDEEQSSSEEDFVGTFEFAEQKEDEKEFAILNPEQIVAEQEREIKAVAELFSLSHTVAAALLRHFQWKKEKLITRYLENPDAVCKEAGVTLNKSGEIPTTSTTVSIAEESVMCSICGDDVEAADCTSLSCMHKFCNDCWKNYLTIKINEGQVTKIKCPNMKCSLVVDELVVKKLVDGPVYEKFIRFITKAFVEDSDGRIKWCPQPNCGHAITADMITGTVVKCKCGYRFCFACHREAHAPASCEEVKQWEKKCKDDSETTHWKYANTKECPKCETSVEKNGGCNHMTCRQCKHEWCWVCLRPWKGHNDYYNCNKFLKAEKKKNSFFSFRNNKKDKIKEKEIEREKNRLILERYLHFFERFANHSHSSELEKQIRNTALTKVSELASEVTTSSELQYILEGTEELLECRNVLKYTYVYAYYLPESGPKKELFEYLQEDLEKTTEQLSETLEAPGHGQTDRLKAVNIIQLAKTKKANLLNAVEQGLTDV